MSGLKVFHVAVDRYQRETVNGRLSGARARSGADFPLERTLSLAQPLLFRASPASPYNNFLLRTNPTDTGKEVI